MDLSWEFPSESVVSAAPSCGSAVVETPPRKVVKRSVTSDVKTEPPAISGGSSSTHAFLQPGCGPLLFNKRRMYIQEAEHLASCRTRNCSTCSFIKLGPKWGQRLRTDPDRPQDHWLIGMWSKSQLLGIGCSIQAASPFRGPHLQQNRRGNVCLSPTSPAKLTRCFCERSSLSFRRCAHWPSRAWMICKTAGVKTAYGRCAVRPGGAELQICNLLRHEQTHEHQKASAHQNGTPAPPRRQLNRELLEK
eukprot:9492997-Pyramimonas_sp.AAC.1